MPGQIPPTRFTMEVAAPPPDPLRSVQIAGPRQVYCADDGGPVLPSADDHGDGGIPRLRPTRKMPIRANVAAGGGQTRRSRRRTACGDRYRLAAEGFHGIEHEDEQPPAGRVKAPGRVSIDLSIDGALPRYMVQDWAREAFLTARMDERRPGGPPGTYKLPSSV